MDDRDSVSAKTEDYPELIEADSITVEVVDKSTGSLYRRLLPLIYQENSNGIMLKGENLEGESAVIALLSAKALANYSELIGRGPDAPQHHDPKHKKTGR